jgi:hypothetical protein
MSGDGAEHIRENLSGLRTTPRPFSLRRLPAWNNSENIGPMKSLAVFRCLMFATFLPLLGAAQEPSLNPAPSDAQRPALQPVPQRRVVSDKLVLNVYAEPDQGSSRAAEETKRRTARTSQRVAGACRRAG